MTMLMIMMMIMMMMMMMMRRRRRRRRRRNSRGRACSRQGSIQDNTSLPRYPLVQPPGDRNRVFALVLWTYILCWCMRRESG